jgi:DNA processing protein
MGSGIDTIYPYQHRALAEQIMEKGLLMSEFSLGTSPKAGHFPRRNRIISGLSMATLVIEATLKSGSLITARLAMEQNRGVLTLPGSIHLPQAQGCHYLIKQGATLVTNYQEVLEEIGVTAPAANKQLPLPPRSSTPDRNVNAIETRVLKSIGFELTPVDRIIQRCDLQPNQVASALATLEVQGFISQLMGGYIRLGT